MLRSFLFAFLMFSASAETLYNGIELPSVWPPRNVKGQTLEPVPTPYLEHRPAVVPIDVGRQLFVDDFLIESTTLRREYHYPQKYAGNPILRPETDLELNRPSNATVRVVGGGLWWDPTRRKFRMWYEAGFCNTGAYAESADGLSWTRIPLDAKPGTNRFITESECRFPTDFWGETREVRTFDSWIVTPDFSRNDPYSHWFFFLRPPGPEAQHFYVADSEDGCRFNPLERRGKCGDASSLFWNPFRQKWIFSLRAEHGPWGKGGTRARTYRETDDFWEGTRWDFKLNASTKDCVMWLQPDRNYPRDPKLKLQPQLYGFNAVAYESILVGTFEMWKGPENSEIIKTGLPKLTEVVFGYSRDGYHFHRPDNTPAIEAAGIDSGKWDAGYVRMSGSLFMIRDEKLWFYYSALKGNPNRLKPFADPKSEADLGFTPNYCGCYDQGAIGVATLRRDGFVSLRPAVGTTRGELVTRPVKFTGCHLFVNAALPKGMLRAEIVDLVGKPLPGYELANSVAFTGDSVKTRMTWRGTTDLSPLVGQTVRFRFVLEGCALNEGDFYAFWVSPTLRGESLGYLGAGGPDYPGIRDIVVK